MCSWNPYGTVCAFLMGPFLFLIHWSLVKCVFMNSLWELVCISYGTLPISHKLIFGKCVFMNSLWDRVCISYGTLLITHKLNFGKICVHEILMGPCVHFLWDPYYYSLNWSLVKCKSINSLWNHECISYGTLPITHKLNFCQIWVHKFIMGPCVHFLWYPSYYA